LKGFIFKAFSHSILSPLCCEEYLLLKLYQIYTNLSSLLQLFCFFLKIIYLAPKLYCFWEKDNIYSKCKLIISNFFAKVVFNVNKNKRSQQSWFCIGFFASYTKPFVDPFFVKGELCTVLQNSFLSEKKIFFEVTTGLRYFIPALIVSTNNTKNCSWKSCKNKIIKLSHSLNNKNAQWYVHDLDILVFNKLKNYGLANMCLKYNVNNLLIA